MGSEGPVVKEIEYIVIDQHFNCYGYEQIHGEYAKIGGIGATIAIENPYDQS